MLASPSNPPLFNYWDIMYHPPSVPRRASPHYFYSCRQRSSSYSITRTENTGLDDDAFGGWGGKGRGCEHFQRFDLRQSQKHASYEALGQLG